MWKSDFSVHPPVDTVSVSPFLVGLADSSLSSAGGSARTTCPNGNGTRAHRSTTSRLGRNTLNIGVDPAWSGGTTPTLRRAMRGRRIAVNLANFVNPG